MARRTFFSFHYTPDVVRAWNVRNAWVTQEREAAGFFDNGLWESSKSTSEEALKNLIREGMKGTSVVCVLNGTATFSRPWVRYEIVRGVLNRNGLLTVDIHGVRNFAQQTSTRGPDPLDYVGVYLGNNGAVYFAELNNGSWVSYSKYTTGLAPGDLWFPAPASSTVVPLSRYAGRYDFANQKGRENIGGWIETAAAQAGR